MRYDTYKMNIKETTACVLIWIAVSVFFSYFFYKSMLASIVLFLFFPLFLKYARSFLKQKRNWEMTLEFKELIRIVATNLQSGSSPENAFANAYRDMEKLYGRKSHITKECEIIVRGLENNIVLEELISSLGERSGREEISEFAEIFSIAKRSGGNLKEIISDTTEVIDSRIEMKREFRILISSKKFEHRIMCLIPFVILVYIGVTSPGYFDILYGNISGILIMSACLAVYTGAFLWGEHIVNLKI